MLNLLDDILKMQGLERSEVPNTIGLNMFQAIKNAAEQMNEINPREKAANTVTHDFSEKELHGFITDMVEMIEEYVKIFKEDFDPEALELYEDLDEFSYYDSENYCYPSKAKAKIACREDMRSLLRSAVDQCDSEKSRMIGETEDFMMEEMEKFGEFIRSFKEAYFDFASLMRTEAKAKVLEKQAMVLSTAEKALEEAGQSDHKVFMLITNWKEETEWLEEEIFDESLKKLFSENNYLDMCTYDRDDNSYCYEMYDAAQRLHRDLENYLSNAATTYKAQMEQLFINRVTGLCNEFCMHLEALDDKDCTEK